MALRDKDRDASFTLDFTDAERALLDLAADDRREGLSLSTKEELLLRLYDQIQELELERAILEQQPEQPSSENVDDQLIVAEQELLESRATFTVQRKATQSILTTDPILKAVHSRAASPAERALLPLINRRDVLSLVQENLANTRAATLEALSNAEVENLRMVEKNKRLASQLLALTAQEESWRDKVDDATLIGQIEEVEDEYKKTRAQRDTLKSVISAMIVGSGVDWARDEKLRKLVLDELD